MPFMLFSMSGLWSTLRLILTADAYMVSCDVSGGTCRTDFLGLFRGGELGVLRVREHPLNVEVHPLIVKSTPSK